MPNAQHLIWLPEAAEDLARLREFIAPENPEAARRAALRIQSGIQILINNPEAGKPLSDGTERRELYLPFGAGAYVLRYRLHGTTVVIIRVWHSREARTESPK